MNNIMVNEDDETVSRAVSGPVRTAAQLVPAAVITEFLDAFVYDFDEKQYAALVAILLLGTSFVQNLIEARRNKAFLK